MWAARTRHARVKAISISTMHSSSVLSRTGHTVFCPIVESARPQGALSPMPVLSPRPASAGVFRRYMVARISRSPMSGLLFFL